MAAIITNKFRIHNAEQFYESFSEAAPSTYYLFVGRPQPFSTATGGGTDTSVPTPVDNIDDEYMYWHKCRLLSNLFLVLHMKRL